MTGGTEKAANVAILVAALAVAGMVMRREFFPAPTTVGPAVDVPPPAYVQEWREVLADGLTSGPTSAPIQVLVFTDLECPFCAKFHLSVLPALESRFPGKISHSVLHLPIPGHRFATQAAVALECAAREGRHEAFLNATYENQDSIGLMPWPDYARKAGLLDKAGFVECLTEPPPDRLGKGTAWAERLNVRATPTIIVNGWRFFRAPTIDELVPVVETLLKGRPPY